MFIKVYIYVYICVYVCRTDTTEPWLWLQYYGRKEEKVGQKVQSMCVRTMGVTMGSTESGQKLYRARWGDAELEYLQQWCSVNACDIIHHRTATRCL